MGIYIYLLILKEYNRINKKPRNGYLWGREGTGVCGLGNRSWASLSLLSWVDSMWSHVSTCQLIKRD